jgi:peptidoglycan/xylan/chitin deacetylase (PgdA/CDA1 family)
LAGAARLSRRARRLLLLGAGVLASGLVTALLVSPPHSLLDRVAAAFPGCRYYVATGRRAVALTIDDGPDPATTPALLDLLARHRARATFFVITEHLHGQEALAERIVREGHELGNHLVRDVPSVRLDSAAFETAVRSADGALRRYGGARWLRPASGWYSRRMIRTLHRHGYRCALGSVYPLDAALPSAAFASRYVLRNVRPGSIVVLHDGGERGRRTLRTLAAVLPELRRRGYAVLTLSALDGLARRR